MTSVHVKVCGLTRPADVALAIEAGADTVGFIFAGSPRQLTVDQAIDLSRLAGDRAQRVGLFMDPEPAEVWSVLEGVELDLLQFHGRESNAFCQSFGVPFLKAISMLDEEPERAILNYPDAQGILCDSHAPGGAGGTGKTFDWRRKVESEKPIWLAGGLTPDNVAEAIRRFQPFAVDVSSGVESSPGVKEPHRLQQFITNAKQARA